jgi:hypothetical protein
MCPLCGLYHSIGKYDPLDLPLDILVPERHGLGRGRGSRIDGYHSILGDVDVTPKVVRRVTALCGFFLNQKLISQIELKNSLGIVDTPSLNVVREHNRLVEEVEALKVLAETESRRADREAARANRLEVTSSALRSKLSNLETQFANFRKERLRMVKELDELEVARVNSCNRLDDLIDTIEKRTKSMFNSAEDSRESFITEVFEKMLEDLEALKADVDE